jgi:DNA-binding PadR family transcriptional regulator
MLLYSVKFLTPQSNIGRLNVVPRHRASSPQTQALLNALSEHPKEWRYGYDLSKQTGLKSGTLYPLLIRLSESGMLESDWRDPEREGKPPRHVYRLTARGLAMAKEELRRTSKATLTPSQGVA